MIQSLDEDPVLYEPVSSLLKPITHAYNALNLLTIRSKSILYSNPIDW